MISLEKAAQKIIQCMNIKKEEKVLIIIDKNTLKIGRAIEKESLKITSTKLLEIPIGKQHGEEPPKNIAEIMKLFDVIIIPTTMSLSHTAARREANETGARISTLPGVTEEMLCRTMEADYGKIARRTDVLSSILDEAKEVVVTTEKGTNITMSIEGRKCVRDIGLIHAKGDFSNLPAGEACLAPLEGKSNGTFIVDASFSGIEKIDSDIKITVKDGIATKIEGKAAAKQLLRMLTVAGKGAFNIAELGIGTNDKAKITGNVLEDEKVMGTAHIALGNNKSFGGKIDIPIHLDGIFYKPTIVVDGKKIMDNGKLMI
jgi:leucyl aminopeptidase (aminopeptidase T)